MNINELTANIAVLDEMLNSETIPLKHYSAVKFAYNVLCKEKWKMESNMRKPEEFPYCSKCGKIYIKSLILMIFMLRCLFRNVLAKLFRSLGIVR